MIAQIAIAFALGAVGTVIYLLAHRRWVEPKEKNHDDKNTRGRTDTPRTRRQGDD
mgnify:CR=1 FL=1